MSGANDSQTDEGGDLGGVRYSGGVISWSQGNDKARFNIHTSAGYQGSRIEKDHSKCEARGYMMDPKDWRNFEATCHVRLQGNGDDQFVIYGRGGTHTGSGNCEGFSYKADIYFSGRTRFAKEQYHVSYVFTGAKNGIGSIEGKWIGFKFCCYDKGNGVQLEIWLDPNCDNNWKMYDSYLDSGGFGDDGGHCNGDDDQIGRWGGPKVTWRWDNADSVEMRNMSVREISANGAFNEGGSNALAGSGQGGSGSGGSGSGGSGSGNPSGNPSAAAASSGPTDMFGTRSTYGTGSVTDKWRENFRDDGKRFDFTGLGSSGYVSSELTGYFSWNDPADDECTGKMGGGNHSDGTKPKCYCIGIDLRTGATRYRLEENHPSTGGGESGPKGTPMGSKWIGYRFIKRNTSNGVLLEIWQDTGNNEGNTPANAWKRISSWVEKSKNWQQPGGDHQETIRIDEDNGGAKDLRHKWISLREIKPSDPTTPFSNSGGGGGSSGGGGSGSGSGSGGGGGTGSGPGGSGGGNGSGSGNGGSNNDDDTGEGGGNTPTDPPPVITIYRDWSFYLNVGVKTDDNCTAGNPLETKEYFSIYNVAPEPLQYVDLGYVGGIGNSEVGLMVANVNSVLFDLIPRRVKVNALKRTVDALLEGPEGNLVCRIVNTKTGEVYAQIGGAQNVAGIDVNDQGLVFTQDDNKHQMKVGDAIVLQYFNTTAKSDKCLKIKHTTKDALDTVNTHMIVRNQKGYDKTTYKDIDVGFEIFL